MNFDFSDEQRQLQDEVRRMLTEVCTPVERRAVLDGKAPYARATWEKLIETGAAAAAIPEEFGGAGLGYPELCLVAEEVGRQLAPVPLSSSFYLGAEALRLGASEAQKRQWLPHIASGELIATAALAVGERFLPEPALTFDGRMLNGGVTALPDGAVARLAVLQTGARLVLVDLSARGVERRALPSLDPTRPFAEVHFTNVPAEPLGEVTDAAALARRVLDGSAVLLAFEQVGGAAGALEMARSYSLERKAFGRAIGGFQALKHKMADIYVRNEMARVHAYYGAWALSASAPELPRAAAAARVAACSAYNFAAEENIEIHGGIGYTWETDCHLYLRRARYLSQVVGSVHLWQARLAGQLVRSAAA